MIIGVSRRLLGVGGASRDRGPAAVTEAAADSPPSWRVGLLAKPANAAAAALALTALVTLTAFDAAGRLASNDDWVYAWTARHLAAGRLHMFPQQSAVALPQMVVGALVGGPHATAEILRLTTAPYLALAWLAATAMAGRLGAGRFWSLAAGAAVACNPLLLSVGTSFMTDMAYVALLLLACWAAMAWIHAGGWTAALATGATVSLAALQRPHGLGLVVALGPALWLARGHRRVAGWEWPALAAVTLAALAAVLLPVELMTTLVGSGRLGILRADVGAVIFGSAAVVALLGLVSLPFVAAIARAPGAPSRPAWRVVVLLAPTLAAGLMALGASIFPGDYLGRYGLGPPHLSGHKPALVPAAAWLVLELASLAAAVVVLFRRHGDLRPRSLGPGGFFLVLVAVVQLLPIFSLSTGILDRYHLPVLLPLVPLLALWASRGGGRAARALALAVISAALAAYVLGEQDYLAWQAARDAAARAAYARLAPDRLQAGYEANGVYWELPHFDATGTLPEDGARGRIRGVPAFSGPADAVACLVFAAADDPRPGVSYRSVSPGRIVLQPGSCEPG